MNLLTNKDRTKKYRRYQLRNTNRSLPLFKSVFLILGLVVALFGLKMLLSPIGAVLGSFVDGSSAVISFMLTGPKELKNDQGVTNFLLLGIDRRTRIPYSYQAEKGVLRKNGFLADTLIVASLNQKTQTVSLLSLPRDLWVKIPGFGQINEQYTKINAAHALGDQFGFEGGGPELLQQTVAEVLGIPIHYWARIDFEGFEKAIDAISGIDLMVENAFDDYYFPVEGMEEAPWEDRFTHLHFDAGLQHMDGITALRYARSRHALGVEGSDFARAKRQQNVIIAVKNKVLSSETLFNLSKLQELYHVISDNVATNVDLTEVPLFYKWAEKAGADEVKAYVLDGSDDPAGLLYSPNPEDFGGAWVLIPKAGLGNYSEIQNFTRKIFYETE